MSRCKKGAGNTLAALKSMRAARPDGAPIYVIMDNLSAHKGSERQPGHGRGALERDRLADPPVPPLPGPAPDLPLRLSLTGEPSAAQPPSTP
ncbi:hypothetical protein ACWCXB_35665 [Streptomyces sp. NPDC001514]